MKLKWFLIQKAIYIRKKLHDQQQLKNSGKNVYVLQPHS
jgi:hypothetical protein